MLLISFSPVYSRLAARYGPHLPHYGDCAYHGDGSLMVAGPIVLISYLGLFINFYLQTYKRRVRTKDDTVNGNAMGSPLDCG